MAGMPEGCYCHPADAIELARRLESERDEARAALETERMRLAACGVVALADTPESAKEARDMLPEYRSASLRDVERRVDECMRLRDALEACLEDSEELLAERHWWADEPRCGYQRAYAVTQANIENARELLNL